MTHNNIVAREGIRRSGISGNSLSDGGSTISGLNVVRADVESIAKLLMTTELSAVMAGATGIASGRAPASVAVVS